MPLDRLAGDLELKDVSFGYSPLEAPLLEHFDLHAPPGQWVAVVGASGSGKSTLAKIVTGLYEEWDGQVLFDGSPAGRFPQGGDSFPGRRGSGYLPDFRHRGREHSPV
ncbi:ATP-binding cassette domain-containing protein [Selenomonas sp. AB3002]|uniref:ATP-binding cassette domain-containing protein n=1 Tax=Selenomonas sp. AB3002 TaxID=1392502 RepID=UPI000A440132